MSGDDGLGPATDRNNEPVNDPTFNVMQLVSAAIARQDDLRQSESSHIREVMTLRAEYDERLRKAETARIDAIRAVDVHAVQQAAQVSATQAATLAAQVATSAETLRNQVAQAAIATRSELSTALAPMQKDIADLRQAQYEAQGQKTQVIEGRSDAADLKPILDAINAIAIVQAQNGGARGQVVETRAQNSNMAIWVGVAATALFGFLAFAVAVAAIWLAKP